MSISSLVKSQFTGEETSGARPPCWYATTDREAFSHERIFAPLQNNLETDVCIVGAGISGLCVAYNLLKHGKKVVILDDGEVASGETGRTTGHLSFALDDHYYNIAHIHGDHGAKIAYESHAAAIDWIQKIIHDEQIECNFERVPGFLIRSEPVHTGTSEKSSAALTEALQMEWEAGRMAGITKLKVIDRAPMPGIDSGQCLLFPDQATFEPLKFIYGLAGKIRNLGGQIYTRTHVDEWHGKNTRVVTREGHEVHAKDLVLATNVPLQKITIIAKLAQSRTYVIAGRIPKNQISSETGTNRYVLYDTADPYHYVRFIPFNEEEDLIVTGGEDHDVGQSFDFDERWNRLEAWTRERWPAMKEITHKWSGHIQEPMDYLGYIGRDPGENHVFVITGDSGNGLTHGAIAGMMITDLIVAEGKFPEWAELYKPSRKSLKKVPKQLCHLAEASLQYKQWLQRGDVADIEDIVPGKGAIVRSGLKHLAVYKDDAGKVYACSAVCTHMKGIVRWNDAEKSWDCPVHGSRFDKFGEVIDGPAETRLQKETL